MAEFPCPLERTVASALLLLSAIPPSPSIVSPPQIGSEDQWLKDGRKTKSYRESLLLSDSTAVSLKNESRTVSMSCTSSLTSEGSSEDIIACRMRMIAVMARRHEMKLKVDLASAFAIVRKSRSKTQYSSCDQEISSAEMVKMSSASVSTDASYLSSSSSPLSSGRSHRSGYVTRGEKTQKRLATTTREEIRRKHVGSVHMRRRSEDILKLLSGGCSSELKIRQLLGDSPDTSKALRMLLKLEEVKRSGTGGRRDPYIYKVFARAPQCSSTI
ncbi:uncharacterized protein LOC121264762 [Juglans microcarpa x Juglans regia]|uniref:uncharacterized protein LOC121264762 n=1 Tax=Juglans microcarpa x Juglans regia TaxID=2249226 RepID=UPI001B7DF22E|nr:uncharacterized protein LOC121264762 [Juglans microcarpa x Juglans regia]